MAVPRSSRLGEELVTQISAILPRLKDPRVQGIVSITRVEVSGDGRHAKVYVSTLGDDEALKEVVRGLTSSAGFIRRELASTMHLRYTPELVFTGDVGIARASETYQVMRELEEKNKKQKEE
jgi:ribosome-binding factor A